jgi:hypothetical protein
VLIFAGCNTQNEQAENQSGKIKVLKEQIAKFVPTELKYDASTLDERQKVVVEKLYRAAKIMDELFLDQVYSKNNEIKADLMAEDTEEAKYQLELFTIMFGPFDRLEHDKPFIETEKKPDGANYYPEDMTKEEFELWLKDHLKKNLHQSLQLLEEMETN